MNPAQRPPRLAERLMMQVLSTPQSRHGVIGDLREEYQAKRRKQPRWACDLWHWRQAVLVFWRFGIAKPQRRLPGQRAEGGMRSVAESIGQDLRLARRCLLKNAAFSLLACSTLALGIGANSAIFSVVNAVLLRPLPYQDPDRLVSIWSSNLKQGLPDGASHPDFLDWKAQSRTLQDIALMLRQDSAILTGAKEPERIRTGRVSANFFSVLGIEPALGRTFTAQEAYDQRRLALISHSLWQSRFGSSPNVLGSSLEVDGAASQIIGVMPQGFRFLDRDFQIWEPLSIHPILGYPWEHIKDYRPLDSFRAFGRLSPASSLEAAQREMNAIAAELRASYPDSNENRGIIVQPLMRELTGTDLPAALWTLQGAVFLVLMVVCGNMASLFLARGLARRGELAIRSALGAKRTRIVRLLLTESLLLASFAGAVGLLLAHWGTAWLIRMAPGNIPRLSEVGLDGWVLAVTAASSLANGVLFGIAPAFRLSRIAPSEALKSAGRSLSSDRTGRSIRALLVLGQIALSVMLLLATGLMIRSLSAVRSVEPGYDSQGTLLLRLDAPRSKYASSVDAAAFYQRVLERLAGLPRVDRAEAIRDFFFTRFPDSRIFLEGQPSRDPGQSLPPLIRTPVTPGFFQALSVPLLAGRYFDERDGPQSQQVAIINQAMGDAFWPGQDPLGRRFKPNANNPATPWITVVGVVADMRRRSLESDAIPQAFHPMAQVTPSTMTLLVRSSSDPLTLIPSIRRQILSIDESAPIYDISTLDALLSDSLAPRRFQTWLLSLFSLVAVLLSVIGVYGVMQNDILGRRKEIGLRLALGATGTRILGTVLGSAVSLSLIGVALGLAGGLMLSSLLQSQLFQVSVNDPLTFVLTPVLILGAGLIGCLVAARRFLSLDPARVLGKE